MTDEVWITVECPVCRSFKVGPEDIVVSVYPTGATYAFSCGCGRRIVRDATPKIVDVLTDAGCEVNEVVLPPRVPLDLPPIVPDEILDLHLGLQDPGFMDELA